MNLKKREVIKKYSTFFILIILILACFGYLFSSSTEEEIGLQIPLFSIMIMICFIAFVIKLGITIKNKKFTKKTFLYSMWSLLAMLPPIIKFLINDGLLSYNYETKQMDFSVFNLVGLIMISSLCFFVLYKLIKSIDNHFTFLSVLGIILLSIFSTLSIKGNEYALYFLIIPIIILSLVVIIIDRIIVFYKKEK